MSAKRMPQPPVGWRPKKPVSTVPRSPDVPGVNDNNSAMNLSDNTKRLNDLEERKLIKDWNYEPTNRGYVYYITLINGDEIALKGGHIPVFYIAALSAMCLYVDSFELMPLKEINLYLYEEE
jgi:hypothetical protein